jgi:malate synthase
MRLNNPNAFVGHKGDAVSPSSIFLKHNDLHIEIVIDRSHPIGATDPSGMCDVVLESALLLQLWTLKIPLPQ